MRSVLLLLALAATPALGAKSTPQSACVGASGDEAAACLDAFLSGSSATPAFTDAAVTDHCTEDVTYEIGGLGVTDLVLVLRNACVDFGKELSSLTTPGPGADAACRATVATSLDALRERTVTLLGPQCSVKDAQGRRCRRPGQEGRARRAARATLKRITRSCGAAYDTLGLPPADQLVDTFFDRVRHFAQLAYPPNDLGPSGDLGPYPV